jgi:integrase
MGTVYKRGRWLWLGFKDHRGEWRYQSSGYRVGQEAHAKAALRAIEEEIRRGGKIEKHGGTSFQAHGETWCQARIDRGLWNAKRELGLMRKHVWPRIGHLELRAVRPAHIREVLTGMAADGKAGRTRSNVYAVVRTLFAEAASDEIIDGTPCVLRRQEIPKRIDKALGWRSTALFTREEAEALVSDGRIDLDRRVVYGLALLGGLRQGEIAALRWGALDNVREPLAALHVTSSYHFASATVKAPKTGRGREVPVHPTLAALLATWKLKRFSGGTVDGGALVVTSTRGAHRQHAALYGGLQADLKLLGLRPRRFHDMRRTFVSLALGDGARKDVLRWVSHGPEGDVMDQYTTLPWAALCEAVGCLKLSLRKGEVVPLRAVVGAPLQSVLQKGRDEGGSGEND